MLGLADEGSPLDLPIEPLVLLALNEIINVKHVIWFPKLKDTE